MTSARSTPRRARRRNSRWPGAALADFYAGVCKGYPLTVALPALCESRRERLAVGAAGAVPRVINGGSRAGGKLPFQEYPYSPMDARTFKEAVRIGAEFCHTLKAFIKEKRGGGATPIGDVGGAVPLPSFHC